MNLSRDCNPCVTHSPLVSRASACLIFLAASAAFSLRSHPQELAPQVQFVDATLPSGLHFQHLNSATSNKYLIETMTGGLAVLDYDNDGWLDVFFVNGA